MCDQSMETGNMLEPRLWPEEARAVVWLLRCHRLRKDSYRILYWFASEPLRVVHASPIA